MSGKHVAEYTRVEARDPAGAYGYKKNVYTLSCGFFGIFMAFQTAQALATSTLLPTQARIQLALLYGLFTVSAIVAPRFVDRIGHRLAMVGGGICYLLYVLAFLWPSDALSIAVGGIVGVGAAVLWTGEGMYLGRCALNYAHLSGERAGDVTSSFNGIFFSVFQFCPFIGQIMGYFVLKFGGDRMVLFILLSVCAGVGCAILLLLKPAPPVADEGAAAGAADEVSLIQTLKLFVSSLRMQCVVPIIFYNGVSLGFFLSSFTLLVTQSLVTPLHDDSNTLLVVAAFFLTNSIASYVFGWAVPEFGRRAIMVLATVTHAIFFVILLILPDKNADAGAYLYYFGLSICFAVGDSVWESFPPAILQNPAMFRADADRSAAMSNYKMWQSFGFVAAFLIGIGVAHMSDSEQLKVQAGVNLGLLGVGALALFYLDRRVVSLGAEKKDTEPLLGVSDSTSQ